MKCRYLKVLSMLLLVAVLGLSPLASIKSHAAGAFVPSSWKKTSKGYLLKGRNGIRDGSNRYEKVKVDGRNYIIDSGGYMVRGWYKYKDSGKVLTYYLNPSGKNIGQAAVGWRDIKNSKTGKVYKYYFDHMAKNRGVMVTGWKNISGNKYYFNKNGVMKTGWLQYKSNWYYFRKNGKMVFSETITIKGKKYKFAKDGKLVEK